MIIDARGIEKAKRVKTDICVLGAGPAGITLAREFSKTGHSVCLVESGGFAEEEATQALNHGIDEGTVARRNHLYESRRRLFGGTTAVWGGWCRPLDEIDFSPRPWVPHSGWPFRKSHLAPYYRRASAVFHIDPFVTDHGDEIALPHPFLLEKSTRVATKVFQLSPLYKEKFGEAYRDELARSKNIQVLLFANAVEVHTRDHGGVVSRVECACLGGNRFMVEPRYIVLAMGGIENPRLLLLSNRVHKAGLGNEHDVLGRYYMEHPWIYGAGDLVLIDSEPLTVLNDKRFATLAITEKVQEHEELMNFRLVLSRYAEGNHKIFSGKIGQSVTRLSSMGKPKSTAVRRAPQYFRMDVSSEQVPNPESRVTLAGERDALGNQQARLKWQLSAMDSDTIRRSMKLIGRELGKHHLGRAQIVIDEDDPWPLRTSGAHHHMGGTRMHPDRRKGVVDADCRVHGVSNLFIAGSSVFPTVGFANPTFTIVALALRLADHLKGLMKTG